MPIMSRMAGFARRQSRVFWALAVLLVLDVGFFLWVAWSPSGEDCISIGPSYGHNPCTAQPHVVGPVDWVVLGSVLLVLALLELSFLRHRSVDVVAA